MTDEEKEIFVRNAKRKWNSTWPAAALLLVALIFHVPIEDLITKFFVDPIFSKITIGPKGISFWAFGVLIAGCFIYWIYKYAARYRLSFSRFVWTLFGFVFYIYFRTENQVWQFTTFLKIGASELSYIDVLFLLLFTFPTIKKEKKDTKINGVGFSTDTPVVLTPDNDGQQRLRYVDTIYRLLKNTDLRVRAFAVGVSGVWGSGKTSFMKTLEKTMSATFISLHFSPWRLDPSQSITESFFGDFAKLLSETTDNSVKDLEAYGRSITSQHSSNPVVDFGKKMLSGVNWDKSSIEELRKRIDDSLKYSKHKFVVYIDDLDRLDDEEILEVLRLIRNAADFPNVVFVVAYDKAQVVSALESKFKHGKGIYLEKIFQHEFSFTSANGKNTLNTIKIFFQDFLIPSDNEALISMFDNQESKFSYNDLESHFRNYRDVSKFLNVFKVHYPFVKGEVFMPDLFRIMILRFRFPTLASILYERRNEFLTNFSGFGIIDLSNTDSVELIFLEDGTCTFKEELKENQNILGLTQTSIKEAFKLVSDIFTKPTDGFWERNDVPKAVLTIRNPKYFDRYFTEDIAGRLSSVEYQKFFAKDKESFLIKIQDWMSDSEVASDLINFLERTRSFESEEEYDKIVSALMLIADYYNIDNTYSKQYIINEDQFFKHLSNESEQYPSLLTKLFNGFANFKEYVLLKLTTDLQYKDFKFRVLRRFAKDVHSQYSTVPSAEAQDILLHFFKASLNQSGNSVETFKMFYDIVDSFPLNRKQQLFDVIRPYILTKDLDSFIEWAIFFDIGNEMYSVYEIAEKIFGSFDELIIQIRDARVSSQYKEEFLKFCRACQTSHRKMVKFEFNKIPVKKLDGEEKTMFSRS